MGLASRITSLILVALLVFMTGLGGKAHALSQEHANAHCGTHMIVPVAEHHVGYALEEATDSVSNGSSGQQHAECNPILCNALALMLCSSEVAFDHSEAVLAWQVTGFATLDEPDNPDRPPNF